jgi:hypothetical protein
MADQSHTSNTANFADKGKGKARDIHEDVEMGENESEEDDESGDDFEVSGFDGYHKEQTSRLICCLARFLY